MIPHRKLLLVLLLAACPSLRASENKLDFATESSIPPPVIEAFKKSGSAEKYVFATQLNPFYIQADFNGDRRLDCAPPRLKGTLSWSSRLKLQVL